MLSYIIINGTDRFNAVKKLLQRTAISGPMAMALERVLGFYYFGHYNFPMMGQNREGISAVKRTGSARRLIGGLNDYG